MKKRRTNKTKPAKVDKSFLRNTIVAASLVLVLAAIIIFYNTSRENIGGEAYSVSYAGQKFESYGNVDLTANTPSTIELRISAPLEKATLDLSGMAKNLDLSVAGQKIIESTGNLEQSYFTIEEFSSPEKYPLPHSLNTYLPKGSLIIEAKLDIDYEATAGSLLSRESSSSSDGMITLEYKSGSSWDSDDNGVETTEGAIDLTVENSMLKPARDASKLCTKWTVVDSDAASETNLCYGSLDCCSFLDLEPSSSNWNDVFYANFGKNGFGNNNLVKAQIVYADYSLDSENPYSNIVQSPVVQLPVNFINAAGELYLNDRLISQGMNDISLALNRALRSCDSSSCKIALDFTGTNINLITISNLKIKYTIDISDFSSVVNNYCADYPCTVPIDVVSETDGTITLSNFDIVETPQLSPKSTELSYQP